MQESYSVKLKQLVERMKLEIVYTTEDYEDVSINTSDIYRPGLQLAGFYDFFDPARIQLFGKIETAFMQSFSPEERLSRIETLMSKKIPAIIVCHGLEPMPECLEMAKKYDVNVFKTDQDTSSFAASIIGALKTFLAPRVTRHGVLMEVYGEGVLLLGESGVGKSEAAIELIKRGHRLIADDAVEIKRIYANTLTGMAPEIIRYYMELRGIGVIDVRRIFGMGAVKPVGNINLLINLEVWREGLVYDRLGAGTQVTSILGIDVPSITIPVKPGRNLAVVIEVAAMNNRQKKMGYNSALEFTKQINRHFEMEAK